MVAIRPILKLFVINKMILPIFLFLKLFARNEMIGPFQHFVIIKENMIF